MGVALGAQAVSRDAALVFTPRLPWPQDDGGRVALWQTVCTLATAYDTTLVSLVADGSVVPAEPAILRELGVRVEYLPHTPPSLPLALVRGTFGRWPYTLARYRSDRVAGALRAIVARLRPRLALVNNLHLAPYIRDLRPATVVLRQQNVETTWLTRFAASRRDPFTRAFTELQARRMRGAERELCEAVDLVLAIHENEAAELRALAPRANVAVMPFAVDEARFLTRAPAAGRVLLTGAFGWPPNAEGAARFLATGWARVRARHSEATLRLVGKDLAVPLAALANAAGAEPVGYVQSIEPEFAAAAVLVVPLWVGAGVRVKIVEALMAGVVVVATPLSAEGLGLEHGREVLIAETPEALGDAVADLLDDPARARELAAAGQTVARARWSVSAVGAEAVRLCEATMREHECRK